MGDLFVPVDPSSTVPLYRQLYESLREAILGGRLSAGTRLPSSRSLADDLDVSRNTVLEAYTQLHAEGYLETCVGSGSYVNRRLPGHLLAARSADATAAPRPPRLSKSGRLFATVPPAPNTSWRRRSSAFYPGVPAYEEFPMGTWRRLLTRAWSGGADPDMLGYGDPAGHLRLREEIADHLRRTRGVRCNADQVVVVGGSQQGLDIAARVLLDPGDAVWMEDPGYPGARSVLTVAGARIVPVRVDRRGLDVGEGKAKCPAARLAYVTPSQQFPLGHTMTLERRLELLDWATSADAWIIEDDYDAEFQRGRPLPALQGLDESGRVIYAGTFSKVLFPSLRMGYLVVPPSLRVTFLIARSLSDRHRPTAEQAALADFIIEGHFSRHIRRLRLVYGRRREALVDALERVAGGVLELRANPAGTHVIGWLPEGVSDREASEECSRIGISAPPLSHYAIDGDDTNAFVLGYTGFNVGEIQRGVADMADVLTTLFSKQ